MPARIIIENAKCAIVRACLHEPAVQRPYVESAVKYVKKNFAALHTLRNLPGGNAKPRTSILEEAGVGCHGTTCEQPLRALRRRRARSADRALDVAPVLATWAHVTVHRDADVQFGTVLYSAPSPDSGSAWTHAVVSTVSRFSPVVASRACIRALRANAS